MEVEWGDAERKLTDRVSVLEGTSKGAYPSGNSVLVRGSSETFLIDPSVDVIARGGAPAKIDAVLNSHAHEDHMTGNGFFADARVHIHEADLAPATNSRSSSSKSSTTRRGRMRRALQTGIDSISAGSRSKPYIFRGIPADIVGSGSRATSSFSRTSTSPDSVPTTAMRGATSRTSRRVCAACAMKTLPTM